MNIVYFTLGLSLADPEIRAQCLRIPEVLKAVREAQSQFEDDLLSVISLDEEFRRFGEANQKKLIEVIQKGLFDRFRGQKILFSEILRRSDVPSPLAAANELRWLLRSGEPTNIFVVGPGVDEVPFLLKQKNAKFIDIIDNDSSLSWFWPEIKKAANA